MAFQESYPEPGRLAGCWCNRAEGACERGDLATAIRWYRVANRLAVRYSNRDMEVQALLGQADAFLRAKRLRRAGILLASGRALAERHGLAQQVVDALRLTAELSRSEGLLAVAWEAARELLRAAAAGQMRWQEAQAHRLLGQLTLGSHPADAVAHLRTALEFQVAMGANLEAARTRLLLAQAMEAGAGTESNSTEARALLAEARTQFIASGAGLDLAQVDQMVAGWSTR